MKSMVGRQHVIDKKPLRAGAKLWQLPNARAWLAIHHPTKNRCKSVRWQWQTFIAGITIGNCKRNCRPTPL
jgi:hypothetical protein